KSIGQAAFFQCTALKSVTIEEGVESIRMNAFSTCTSLKSVTIPGSVTSIGLSAFYKCTALESVTILSGSTKIDNNAFFGDTNLTKVYFAGTEEQWESIKGAFPNASVFYKLTITANDQTYTYDGQPHGEADPPYNDPDMIKEKVTVKGLLDGDEVTSIVLTGTKTEIGEYKDAIEITGFTINNDPDAKNKYAVTTIPGKLTIKSLDPIVYNITAVENDTAWGTVTGAGTYDADADVTLTAIPNDGYVFDCWTEGGTRVDGAGAEYTFTASCARNLVANFRKVNLTGIEDREYTGEAITQDNLIVDRDGVDVKLEADTDYTVSYEDNKDAGQATVIVDFMKDFTGRASGTFQITPKPVTITVDSASKTQNETDPGFTGTVEGLVKDGDLGEIAYVREGSDEDPGTYEGVLTAEYTDNDNYNVTVKKGDFTIEEASAPVEEPEEPQEPEPQKPQKEKEEKEEPEEEPLPFKDVQKTDYFYDAVKWAWEKGMTAGVSEDLFGPALGCTRAQFVTLLYGAAGSPEVSGDMPFSDVPEDLYFYRPVLWAYQNGITAGNSDGTFGAAQTVTRAQAVTMLYGMKGRPEVSGDMPFSDVPEDAYYYTPVLWAYGQGITAGTGDGAFSPEDPCTRAQIVTMLCAALTE
ncbi:MAG: S-layer homology domain-containing protein, partial [Firmicutes bacterium]|nr:S-layer homology domain-containing protein [Bacillota bacterium]